MAYLLKLENDEEMQPKTPAWERTGRILLPALSLIAFIVAQVMSKSARLSWLLILLTVVFVISGYHTELQSIYRRWKGRRDNQRTVDKAFPEFREFIRRFGTFVDNRRNDTLHHIVHNDLYPQLPNSRLIQFPNIDLWGSHWLYFSQKLDHLPLAMTEFRPALMEFHFLVGSYCSYCVGPIFENPPQGFHSEIPPGIKSRLNLFQQRLTKFLEEYQNFSQHLSESRPSLNGLPIYCLMPSPIP